MIERGDKVKVGFSVQVVAGVLKHPWVRGAWNLCLDQPVTVIAKITKVNKPKR